MAKCVLLCSLASSRRRVRSESATHHKWSGSINSASLGVDGAAALASWYSPGSTISTVHVFHCTSRQFLYFLVPPFNIIFTFACLMSLR